MSVDIVIPVYSPKEDFYESISRLCRQSVLPKRIVLMNTEVTKGDSSVLRERAAGIVGTDKIELVVQGIDRKDFDHGGTRTEGLRHCNSEFVLYMTQDAVPKSSSLIESLIESFKDERVAVAYARQLPSKAARETEKLSRYFNYPERSCIKTAEDIERLGIKTYFSSNACAMYRRKVLKELGGFEKGTRFAEDMLFAFKAVNAGYAVAYKADARVIHSHNYTYKEQFKRNFEMAASQSEHPELYKSVSSEKEGLKYVSFATKYFLKKGKIFGLIDFYIESAFKYAGFFFGRYFGKKRV